MINRFLVFFIIIFLTSCGGSKEILRRTATTDTIRLLSLSVDSVYVRDSIYNYVTDSVVVTYKQRDNYHYVRLVDTISVTHNDTIYIEKLDTADYRSAPISSNFGILHLFLLTILVLVVFYVVRRFRT